MDRSKGIVAIFILVIALFIIFLIFSFYTMTSLGRANQEGNWGDSKNAEIAMVKVEGVILDSDKVVNELIRAEKDKSIKAIIVRINSPGGAVGPTQEIYEEIIRIDQEKPVYASFGTVAASGGYYIGAAARRIYTNAGTLTGSIGVIMQFINLKDLYEFVKMQPYVKKAGKYKDFGSPLRQMSNEENELVRQMLDQVHQQFIADIIRRREQKIQGKIIDHAQGQIFSGQGALQAGLVDKIGSLWQAGREIHQELGLKGEFGIREIKTKKKFEWDTLFQELDESVANIKTKIFGEFVPMYLLAQ